MIDGKTPHVGDVTPPITLDSEDRFMIDVAADLGDGEPTVARTNEGALIVHVALQSDEQEAQTQ